MHPTRNWYLSRDQVEASLKQSLGLDRVLWLGQGLVEDLAREPDRNYYGTDGHIDLFFCFIAPNRALMLRVPESDPNAPHLAASRRTLELAGIEVVGFPFMSGFASGDRYVIAPYLNFYICNGAVIVPVAGADPDLDEEAIKALGNHFPGRQIVPIRMRAAPMQGGAIHCLTQQSDR